MVISNHGDANKNDDNDKNNNNQEVFNNNGKTRSRELIPNRCSKPNRKPRFSCRDQQPHIRKRPHNNNNYNNGNSVYNNNDNISTADYTTARSTSRFGRDHDSACQLAVLPSPSATATFLREGLADINTNSSSTATQSRPSAINRSSIGATASSLLRTLSSHHSSLNVYKMCQFFVNKTGLRLPSHRLNIPQRIDTDLRTKVGNIKIGCVYRTVFDNNTIVTTNVFQPNCNITVLNKFNDTNGQMSNNISTISESNIVSTFRDNIFMSLTSIINTFKTNIAKHFEVNLTNGVMDNIVNYFDGKITKNSNNNIANSSTSEIANCFRGDIATSNFKSIITKNYNGDIVGTGSKEIKITCGNGLISNILNTSIRNTNNNNSGSNTNNNHSNMAGDEEYEDDEDPDNRIVMYINPPFDGERKIVHLEIGDVMIAALWVLLLILMFVAVQYWKDQGDGGEGRNGLMHTVDRPAGAREGNAHPRRRRRY